jgi:hypothetical protein
MPSFSWLQTTSSLMIGVVLFFLLIAFYFLGYQLRLRKMARSKEPIGEDLGAISGTLLGLLALMLAFTFGMSNSRYDSRRALVVEEANDIGTVILRTDIFPDSIRQELRAQLKEYVKARVEYYETGMNLEKAYAAYVRGNEISGKVWSIVASYAQVDPSLTKTSEIIPALNAMIDIVTTRRAVGEATIPESILYFLFTLCLTSSFLLGYDRKNRLDLIVVVGFALMLSATVFTIIDLDKPRSGLITMDKANQNLVALLEMFRDTE